MKAVPVNEMAAIATATDIVSASLPHAQVQTLQ
jgi:hypothetical protein